MTIDRLISPRVHAPPDAGGCAGAARLPRGHTRAYPRWMSAARAPLLAALLAALASLQSGCPGLGKAIGGCRGTKDCREEGRCGVNVEAAGDAAARCFTVSRADCAAS